jgi:hypothetical protein
MGCQSGREFHYFRQGDNYYRLMVTERAFLSSSRYQSGHYDEDAVDDYFGEIKRPDSTARIIPVRATTPTPPVDNASEDTKQTDEVKTSGAQQINKPNSKLVLILSTNSEAVAEQIGNLAQNEETLEILARLANKDIMSNNTRLTSQIAQKQGEDNALLEFGSSIVATIPDTAKTVANLRQIRSGLLAFINSIAAASGRKIPFTTLEDAQKWFYDSY